MTRLTVGAALMSTAMLASSMPLPVEYRMMPQAIHWRSQAEERIAQRVKKMNRRADADLIAATIMEAAKYYQIDPLLVATIIEVESNYDRKARGARGERGLMQIMYGTARDLNLPWSEAYDVEANIWAGTQYLARHLADYGNVVQAASRYNGTGVAARQYAHKVAARYNQIALAETRL